MVKIDPIQSIKHNIWYTNNDTNTREFCMNSSFIRNFIKTDPIRYMLDRQQSLSYYPCAKTGGRPDNRSFILPAR